MLEMSSSTTTTNWLAFSLSSHHEYHHTSTANASHGQELVALAPLHLSSSSVAASSPLPSYTFFLPTSQPNAGHGFYAVDETETLIASSIYPSHDASSLLPLNSDGSLCIMEGFNRTHDQGMGPCQSPKLEDFMGTHQVQSINNEKEDMPMMPLNLDTNNNTYYVNHMPIAQNFNYFQPLEGMMCRYPALDWTGYNLVEQNMASDHTQFLDLSISNIGSHQSDCVGSSTQEPEPPGVVVSGTEGVSTMETSKKRVGGKSGSHKQSVRRKSVDTFGHRTSQFRGVTRHRWTGRYEAHLWDNSCKKEGQARKGRQVYLGGYDSEEKAARAYDLAALKYWGPSTSINLPVETYKEEIEEMKSMTRQEFVAHIRRRSSGFSRGASIYRGVTRHHQHGRWQARIGRVSGNKDLYLGTFNTQEEAAEAYDIAAIKFRGVSAVTNFDINRYDVDRILSSNMLLPCDQARKTKPIIELPPQANPSITIQSTNKTNQQCDNLMSGTEGEISNIHFSNSSSLVTSLSNSREATPERSNTSAGTFHYKEHDSRVFCNMVPASSLIPDAPVFAVSLDSWSQ